MRSLYAYRRQIDTVGAFVRTAVPAGLPLVFAGDFNAGKRLDRRGYLVESAATWRPQGAVSVAMDECLADGGCAKSGEADLRYSFKRGKDWQFFSSGRMTSLRVAALSVPFGHDRMGEMLSDHVGYIARYTLGTAARAIDLRLASR